MGLLNGLLLLEPVKHHAGTLGPFKVKVAFHTFDFFGRQTTCAFRKSFQIEQKPFLSGQLNFCSLLNSVLLFNTVFLSFVATKRRIKEQVLNVVSA